MKQEAYLEEHPVELTDEERRLRASTASRGWPRLAEQEAAIDARKKAQKEEIAKLEGEKRDTITRAREASRAAHEGHEPRQVLVRQRFVPPNTVITVREDTGETVHDRAASEDEIREYEAERIKASKAKPLIPKQIRAKLDAALAGIDAKLHAAKWVTGKLTNACPDATPADVSAAIAAAIDDGRLIEDDGKLRAGTPRQPGAAPDDGIVDDDDDYYVPSTH